MLDNLIRSQNRMATRLRLGVIVAAVGLCACRVQPAAGPEVSRSCDAVSPTSITRVALPGRAFQSLSTADGCWMFVSMHPRPDSGGSGVAVIRRVANAPILERTVPGPPPPPRFRVPGMLAGMALTHDNRILIVAALDRLSFFDVAGLTSGAANALAGELRSEGALPGYFQVALASNDSVLFVSNHNGESITVINLAEARRSSFARIPVIGKIPTGYGPGAIVLSRDGRYLYATTQLADPNWHWPNACRAPGTAANVAPNRSHGAVHVIDVSRAVVDPTRAVIMTTDAGCDPVRLVLSPTNDRAYITARTDNTLLAFDARKLVDDSAHALIGRVRTHAGPVGVVVFDGGRRVAVANALRFTGVTGDSEVVSVIDAEAIGTSRNPVIGNVPSDGPADLELTRDRRTIVVSNYEPQGLTLISIAKLPSR